MPNEYKSDFGKEHGKHATPARQAGSRTAGWYTSALDPEVDARNKGWGRGVRRWRLIGGAARLAAVLVWLIVVFQLAMGLSQWAWPFIPPLFFRHVGTVLAGLILPVLMGFIWSAWSNPSKRRTLGIIWDPLTRLYAWGFPGYITPEFVLPLIPGQGRRLSAWRNYWYATDPIGSSPITPLLMKALPKENDQGLGDGKEPSNSMGGVPAKVITALQNAADDATTTAKSGGIDAGEYADRFLLDPASCGFVYGTIAKSPGGHSGYWSDSRVWDDIDQVAAGLASGQADDAQALRATLHNDLTTAVKARDTHAKAALRTAIAAIDNAEALPAPGTNPPTISADIAGAGSGPGSTEAARRHLGASEVRKILRGLITEFTLEADRYDSLGQASAAEQLLRQARVLEAYLE
jgi:hypothetical protein